MLKKFLCDEMCSELGHWLRSAGYDTLTIDQSCDDQKIFQKAVDEHRRLLTKDKHFKKLDRTGQTIVYLKGESLDEWAEQLRKQEKVDWLHRPFSRCLKCNSVLARTDSSENVPELVRQRTKEFWFCSHCNHTYWLGSHTDRMLERLRGWKQKNEHRH
jgi:hypothetical protein